MPGARLTLVDREKVGVCWVLGFTVPVIAEIVGKHRTTIWRELRQYNAHKQGPKNPIGRHRDHLAGRDGVYRWGYLPRNAHRDARRRARRPKPRKLADPRFAALQSVVVDGLRSEHSPRQIAERLKLDFPHDVLMRVSPETIYQSFYLQSRGGLRELLGREVKLRQRHVQRLPQRCSGYRRRQLSLLHISKRPAEAKDKAVPGHWEGDLLVGAGGRSAIGTLVERATRFVVLVHLPDAAHHQPAAFADLAAEAMLRLPDHLRRSLTWDRGIEMVHGHLDFQLKAQMPVYFCDPHSPWQRGTNENTNGLLRQYFPKGTSLAKHDQAHLDAIADRLNSRPRETLSWHTPAERLSEVLDVATAA